MLAISQGKCLSWDSIQKDLTLFIASLALTPRGVLAATAALNISPVAKWHKQYSSFMIGDWVPFPDPGGPALTFYQVILHLNFWNYI